MTLDPKVFKAYDVRGIVPDELDADGAYRIARAYVDAFEPRKIAVGHDMRVSSLELHEAAIRGVLDAGCDVDDIGLCGTEMLYFAVGELGLDGGVAVTASHNPKEYTGMKIVRAGALPVGGDSGLLLCYADDHSTGTVVGHYSEEPTGEFAIGTVLPVEGDSLTSTVPRTGKAGRLEGYEGVSGEIGRRAR